MTATSRARDRTDDRPRSRVRATTSSRHPGDAIRVGVGVALVLVSLLAIQRDRLTTFELDLFRLVNDLPDALAWVLGPVMQMGNVFAAPATAAVAFVALRRHRRVAVDITVAGFLAWIGAKFVKSVVERPRPGGLVEDVFRIAGTDGLGFVSGHTAVATAIVAAASPYLPRRARRLVWAVPLAVGLARIYYGAHLPLDIVGGAALGWAIAAALHLVLGAPRRVPTPADAERVLTAAGVAVDEIERLDADARGSFPFVARIGGASRFVKLLDPEPRDRDWIYRTARFFAFRDVRDEAELAGPSAQAHREAAMTLLAQSHGARVPTIVAIESDGDRVWIVEEHVASTTLDRLSPAAVTDDVLDSLWEQLTLLRNARIAHRDLVASNVLVDAGSQVWIVDFAHAESSRPAHALDNDVAELLVSTAFVVGAERSVDAARRMLAPDALVTAVPELQRFVLTGENQRNLRGHGALLEDLRARISGTADAPVEDEADTHTGRAVAVIALAVATLAALVGVAGPGDVVDVLSTPGFRWLGLAFLCVLVVPVSAAATLLAGIDRRLALGRTAGEVMVFQQRATLGGRDVGQRSLIRRLAQAGVPSAEATTALARWTKVRVVTSLVAVIGLAAIAAASDASFSFDGDASTVAVVLGGALAVELALGYRTRAAAMQRPSPDESGTPVRADLIMMVLTSVGGVGLGVLATTATVLAMGGGVALASVCLVAAAAGTVARVAPVAGGPGTAAALLALGLVAAGMPVAVAAAAALVAQLLQLWVPVVGGAIRSTLLAPW